MHLSVSIIIISIFFHVLNHCYSWIMTNEFKLDEFLPCIWIVITIDWHFSTLATIIFINVISVERSVSSMDYWITPKECPSFTHWFFFTLLMRNRLFKHEQQNKKQTWMINLAICSGISQGSDVHLSLKVLIKLMQKIISYLFIVWSI